MSVNIRSSTSSRVMRIEGVNSQRSCGSGLSQACRGICGEQALHPGRAGFLVPVLDAAAGLQDLVGAHGRVADDHEPVVAAVGAHQLRQRRSLGVPAPVVLPHRLVDAVVEVEVLEVLELAARGREQLLADPHVFVHRPADVEEQQHFRRVVPFRDHADVEQPGAPRGRVDGALEVEGFSRALAREAPEST